jgi:N6-L-threonylcarbamoyladenine synthase
MLERPELDFSFSGLKTAVVLACAERAPDGRLPDAARADIAAEFQEAVVDVLVGKCVAAIERSGLERLVVAGGVGANTRLRERLSAESARSGFRVFYPAIEFCTDNGAMIALAAALRLQAGLAPASPGYGFTVRPRWELSEPGDDPAS